MRIEGETGFVLHARPWRETSLLVEVLSAGHGRIGLVARGVQSPKRQVLRAALQPLQHIRFDAVMAGELAQLRAAESLDAAPQLAGDAWLAAFYLNELVLRLLPRGEPQPDLFWRYAECLGALGEPDAPMAWELRRFERDLLAATGYALELEAAGEGGETLDPGGRYRVDPMTGPYRVRDATAESVSGAALLALGEDRKPDAEGLRELRRLLREVLRHHLGGRELRSWQLLSDLAGARRGREGDRG